MDTSSQHTAAIWEIKISDSLAKRGVNNTDATLLKVTWELAIRESTKQNI